jgi:3-hydroxybutyryl-CoA dehydrogenase
MRGPLLRIAVCGAGAMGSGIAQVAAQAGASVLVFDVLPQALESSRQRIQGSLNALVERGRMAAAEADEVRSRIDWVSALDDLDDREIVIEAVIEDMAIKADLFARLEAVVAPDAILASNTSSLPISRLARELTHPERFVGMHFFNPATAMKLVEVIAGAATSPDVIKHVVQTAKAWGKIAIEVADVPGFIVNRVARPYYSEGFTALTEGAAKAEEIDALFRAAGFRMGPLELTDLIGQDVNFAVARSVFDGYFGRTRFVPQLRQAALVDAGWLGRKSGRGVYDYSTGVPPISSDISGLAVTAKHQEAAEALTANPHDFVDCDGVMLGLTCGATARAESRRFGRPVALYDWTAPGNDGLTGFTVSHEEAVPVAVGVLAAQGRAGCRIADRPGLIVARTLAQIANAAADAALEQVADEAGIDGALRYGANYPFGPFAWADGLGRAALVELLDAIAAESGAAIYHPSAYLRATA